MLPVEDRCRIEGFVLAGGKSSRMGQDKALLELGGVALIERAAWLAESVAGSATIIGANDAFSALGLRVVEDDWPGSGPLGGIATALRMSDAEWNLVIACDLPYLTRAWLEFLVGSAPGAETGVGAIVPMNERGAEPLCAMYAKRSEPAIRAALEGGTRKVTDGLASLRVKYLEPAEWKGFDSDGLLFKNMNSPEDYTEARRRIGGREKR
jgi:molybdopterin-guanine dinucleotide biosynthesis protein A